jgi:hypothetical protein
LKGNKMSASVLAGNQPRYRLSRKARLFRTAILLALVITLVNQVGQWQSAQATNHGASASVVKASTHYVSVRAGQSLWSLATIYAPNTDPRDWIATVATMNQLTSVDVVPGQRIAIPSN